MTKNTTAQEIKSQGFCLASLKVDDKKAKEGIWVPYIGGCKFLIAKTGSPAYAKWISNYMKEHETLINSGTPEGEKCGEQGLVEAVARFELIDWEGVADEDGNDLPYSLEKAKEYLSIDEVFEFVRKHSSKHELYRVESVKKMGKN